jgi:hypothetical protein
MDSTEIFFLIVLYILPAIVSIIISILLILGDTQDKASIPIQIISATFLSILPALNVVFILSIRNSYWDAVVIGIKRILQLLPGSHK